MTEPRIHIPTLAIEDFCRRWKISEFSLFGSVLREDFRPDSDVDVLVEFEPDHPWSLYDVVDMEEELDAMLGRQVHLVMKGGLKNPLRRREILRARQVIYAA
jgi:predicted nucleotidyltransferase